MIRMHKTSAGKRRYYVYTTEPGSDRKRYVGKAPTHEEAEQLERGEASKHWQIKHGLREPDPTSLFRDLAKPWVDARGEVRKDGRPRREAWRDDVCRMEKHILPFWGDRPIKECGSVDLVRRFLRDREGAIGGTTLKNVLHLLSRFFNELPDAVRRAVGNPVRELDKADRPRPSHDPKDTPFLESKTDIRKVLDALPTPVREIYAVCVFAGLRPGEARALYVEDINLGRRTLHVQRAAKDKVKAGDPEARVGPTKGHASRFVPIGDDLLHVLRAYLPRRADRQAASRFLFACIKCRPNSSGMVDIQTIERVFNRTRDDLRLPAVNFYQASRHTFASHYVIDGGSIERLSKILGHSSVVITERYAHLRSDHFVEHDFRSMLGLATKPLKAVTASR